MHFTNAALFLLSSFVSASLFSSEICGRVSDVRIRSLQNPATVDGFVDGNAKLTTLDNYPKDKSLGFEVTAVRLDDGREGFIASTYICPSIQLPFVGNGCGPKNRYLVDCALPDFCRMSQGEIISKYNGDCPFGTGQVCCSFDSTVNQVY